MKWWNTSFFAGSSFAYIRWHEKCSIWYFGDTLQLLCKIGNNNRSIILQYNGFMCVRAVATIHACTGQVLCQSCCFDNFWLSFVSLGSTAQVRLSASFEQTSTLSLQSISAKMSWLESMAVWGRRLFAQHTNYTIWSGSQRCTIQIRTEYKDTTNEIKANFYCTSFCCWFQPPKKKHVWVLLITGALYANSTRNIILSIHLIRLCSNICGIVIISLPLPR